jgi:hypothetical protein
MDCCSVHTTAHRVRGGAMCCEQFALLRFAPSLTAAERSVVSRRPGRRGCWHNHKAVVKKKTVPPQIGGLLHPVSTINGPAMLQ